MGVVIDVQRIIQLVMLLHGIDLHVIRHVRAGIGATAVLIFRRLSQGCEPSSVESSGGIGGFNSRLRRPTKPVIVSSLYTLQTFLQIQMLGPRFSLSKL
jgi:hypothetical protein